MEGGKLRTFLLAVMLAVPAVAIAPSSANAGPCLTTPTDPLGCVSGAAIQTYIDLGVNPAVTCIRNGGFVDCPETPEPNALLLFGTALLPLGVGALRRWARID